ncbi:hypothetical protein [Tuwongella immobilis]|uniref:DUF4350 domain-containing protein n=1 Tax=Tuwongella immobilis TaxID=692036 RepID=A0A6C2YN28_9BACT|nr:hypothetical protein [Tuwongella immobilis]VIP03020.1 unnamed protein product [Tuwongella immobilis]VTS03148.1 unnamed protein product [Tuwongella immobilis]
MRYRLILVTWMAVTLGSNSAIGQDKPTFERTGTEAFRALFNTAGIRPVRSLNLLRNRPTQSILVVLGDPFVLDRFPVREFINDGGAVLIATDFRQYRPYTIECLAVFGISSTNSFVRATDLKNTYRDQADCPLVKPVAGNLGQMLGLWNSAGEKQLREPFQGLTKIATNRPNALTAWGSQLQPVAMFPNGCEIQDGINRRLLNQQYYFGVGRALTDDVGADVGRVMILSDHSIFINEMMLQTDNQNLDFAERMVTWLKGGSGQRDRILYLDNGVPRDDFNFRLSESPAPPLPPINVLANALMQTGNQVIAQAEDRNVFNDRFLGRRSRSELISTLWNLGTLAIIAWGIFRLWRSRFRVDAIAGNVKKSTPPPVAAGGTTRAAKSATSPPTTLDAKILALAPMDDVGIGVQTWIRESFRQLLGGTVPPTDLPAIWVTGSWWHRRRVRAQVLRFWRLAWDSYPASIRRKRWLSLALHWQHLQQQAQSGVWGFAKDNEVSA